MTELGRLNASIAASILLRERRKESLHLEFNRWLVTHHVLLVVHSSNWCQYPSASLSGLRPFKEIILGQILGRVINSRCVGILPPDHFNMIEEIPDDTAPLRPA